LKNVDFIDITAATSTKKITVKKGHSIVCINLEMTSGDTDEVIQEIQYGAEQNLTLTISLQHVLGQERPR